MARSKRQRRFQGLLKWMMKSGLKVLVVLMILTWVQVFILRYVDPPFTAAMAWNWIRGKILSQPHGLPSFHWRAMKDITPHMARAVMAAEDQRFLTHYGFDFIEMKWAFRDLLSSRRLRGASTISMQAARTVFLWRERSWSRKLSEAYYTLLIEIMWSK
ncbi:MAG: transglycosylase domain-containing protein, partial [Pseudomonadota bacterium]